MKKKNKKLLSILLIVSALILCIIIFRVSNENILQNNTFSDQTETSNLAIVPTIIPSDNEEWHRFIYPEVGKEFSFSFPSEWKVRKSSKINEFSHYVMTYEVENASYEFMINGTDIAEYRGAEYSNKDEIIQHNGREISIKTLYYKGAPFALVAYLNDFDREKDAIHVINMQLPSSNSEKYILIFKQIINSLEFMRQKNARLNL